MKPGPCPDTGCHAVAAVLLLVSSVIAHAGEPAGKCGLQQTPQQTWQSWYEHYQAGRWKGWYGCHDEAAQAGLFLMAFLYTPDSRAKQQIMRKYGICAGRTRPSMECITGDNVADFFSDVTVADEEAAKQRLAKIWSGGGVLPLPEQPGDVHYRDADHASIALEPAVNAGTDVERSMSFVRVGDRWYVTFRWGM